MTTKFKPRMEVYATRGLPELIRGTIIASSGRWHMVRIDKALSPGLYGGRVRVFSSRDLLTLDDPKVEALRPLIKELDLINETQDKIEKRWRELWRETDEILGRKRRR